eukprot:tig00021179_g19284.t1
MPGMESAVMPPASSPRPSAARLDALLSAVGFEEPSEYDVMMDRAIHQTLVLGQPPLPEEDAGGPDALAGGQAEHERARRLQEDWLFRAGGDAADLRVRSHPSFPLIAEGVRAVELAGLLSRGHPAAAFPAAVQQEAGGGTGSQLDALVSQYIAALQQVLRSFHGTLNAVHRQAEAAADALRTNIEPSLAALFAAMDLGPAWDARGEDEGATLPVNSAAAAAALAAAAADEEAERQAARGPGCAHQQQHQQHQHQQHQAAAGWTSDGDADGDDGFDALSDSEDDRINKAAPRSPSSRERIAEAARLAARVASFLPHNAARGTASTAVRVVQRGSPEASSSSSPSAAAAAAAAAADAAAVGRSRSNSEADSSAASAAAAVRRAAAQRRATLRKHEEADEAGADEEEDDDNARDDDYEEPDDEADEDEEEEEDYREGSSNGSATRRAPGAKKKRSGGASSGDRTRRSNLPKPATAVLMVWFKAHLENPYPTDEEKEVLVQESGITLVQVNNWFINARKVPLPSLPCLQNSPSPRLDQRYWKPELKEMHRAKGGVIGNRKKACLAGGARSRRAAGSESPPDDTASDAETLSAKEEKPAAKGSKAKGKAKAKAGGGGKSRGSLRGPEITMVAKGEEEGGASDAQGPSEAEGDAAGGKEEGPGGTTRSGSRRREPARRDRSRR